MSGVHALLVAFVVAAEPQQITTTHQQGMSLRAAADDAAVYWTSQTRARC